MPDESTVVDYAAVKDLTGGDLPAVVLEVIEDNRDRWYQGAWRQDLGSKGEYLQPCDGIAGPTVLEAFAEDPLNPQCTTAFCFAGWVGAIKGVKWAKGDQESVGDPNLCDCKTPCCVVADHQISIAHFARRELGLAHYEGELLFNGDNDIWALQQMVEQLQLNGSINGVEDGDDDDDD